MFHPSNIIRRRAAKFIAGASSLKALGRTLIGFAGVGVLERHALPLAHNLSPVTEPEMASC